MLKIKNLTIKYSRLILDSIDISFTRGTVTVIKGLSGKGKSSLLNVLGLIKTPNKECIYSFENEDIDFTNEEKKANFRLGKIGFIFQANNLIQSLTAIENIMVPLSMINDNKEFIEEKAKKLSSYVGLGEVIHNYPADLSGGEEQRVAIARALMNDTEIILADEPTASLDPENSRNILELFQKMAHELNKIVIIVSHDEVVAEIADALYEIDNKKLNLIYKKNDSINQNEFEDQKEIEVHKKLFGFIRNYEKIRKKEKGVSKVLISSIAIIAAVSSLFLNFGDAFSQKQKEFVNSISERSIFVINDTLGFHSQINYDSDYSFSNDEYETINKIKNIEKIYPFYEFSSNNRMAEKGRKESGSSVTLLEKDKVIKKIRYNINSDDSFSIIPIYPEEEISNLLLYRAEGEDIRDGVVITESFARTLDVNTSKLLGKTLEIKCFVPTKLYETQVTVDEKVIPSDTPVQKIVTIKKIIYGIMDNSNVNQRSEEADNFIYLDYDEFINILNQNKDTKYDKTNPEFPQKELSPSALVVFVRNFEDVASVKSKIEKISSNFDVVSKGLDLKKVQANIEMIKKSMWLLSLILISIVMILCSFVFYFKNRTRKKEIAILKALGLSRKEVIFLIGYEMLLISIRTFLLSILFISILLLISRILFLSDLFIISFSSIVYCLFLTFFIVIVSGISSVWKTSKIDIIDAIRGNK